MTMEGQSHPLVCFIVPVHNSGAFLDQALGSIRAQTYSNWNCVVFNNASTDGSGWIAARHAAEEPRIRVEENRGAVLASLDSLNHAMTLVDPAAEFVKVLHADDRLHPECVEKMVACARRHPTAGIISSLRRAGDRMDSCGLDPDREFWLGKEIGRHALLISQTCFGAPSTLLLRAGLVRARRPFYPTEDIHADTNVCYHLLKETDFAFLHQVFSLTRRHNQSVSSRFCDRVRSQLPARLYFIRTHGPDFLEAKELREVEREWTREYLKFLAHQWLARVHDTDFRNYHREKMGLLGLRLSLSTRIEGVLLYLADETMYKFGYHSNRPRFSPRQSNGLVE